MSISKAQLFGILLLFTSYHLYGVGRFSIGPVNIGPWDIATVILCGLWVWSANKGRWQLTREFRWSLGYLLVFFAWMVVGAVRSPLPLKALTMVLIYLRDFVLFFICYTWFCQKPDLQRINRWLAYIASGIAAVSIIMFTAAFMNYSAIRSAKELWRPAIGYVFDQGGILRLIGFAYDPNFYSLWLSLGLLCALAARFRPSWLRWVLFGIMALSIALASSRTFLIAAVAGTTVVGLVSMSHSESRKHFRSYIGSLFGGSAIAGLLILTWSIFQTNILQIVLKRFQMIFLSPRFAEWGLIIKNGLHHILLGEGLRAAQTILSGKYAHNSYLELLVDTGAIGLALFLLLSGYLGLIAVKSIRIRPELLPWVHTWIILLFMLFAFSLLQNPFYWMLAGVIVGACASPEPADQAEEVA